MSPLRPLEVILSTTHSRNVWGKRAFEQHAIAVLRAGTWINGDRYFQPSRMCRMCDCPSGFHQREHPRMRVVINPSLVREVRPLWGLLATGRFALLRMLYADPKDPTDFFVVEGTVDSVLEQLSYPEPETPRTPFLGLRSS